NADAAESFRAHRVLNALRATVDTPQRLLDGHEQKCPENGDIALAAWADDRRHQPWLAGTLDVVGVEPVKTSEHGVFAVKGEIRIRKTQYLRRRGSRRDHGRIGGRQLVVHWRRDWQARWSCGIEEARRLGQACHQFQIAGSDAGIAKAGLQADTWIAYV